MYENNLIYHPLCVCVVLKETQWCLNFQLNGGHQIIIVACADG